MCDPGAGDVSIMAVPLAPDGSAPLSLSLVLSRSLSLSLTLARSLFLSLSPVVQTKRGAQLGGFALTSFWSYLALSLFRLSLSLSLSLSLGVRA